MLRLTVALSLLIAPAANALSCKAPNYGEDFNRIAAAEEVYSLAYGQFREAGPVPEYEDGEPREFVVAFVGKLMGSNGFGETQSLPVTIKTECASAWCGPVPTLETQMLVFLEQVPGALQLTSHVCPTDFFASPSLGQISAIRACMTDGTCGADEIEAFNLN